MIQKPTGSKRLEGTDLVSANNFNEVFSSLDTYLDIKNNIAITESNQLILNFIPEKIDNNICISMSIRLSEQSNITLYINYQDRNGNQIYSILNQEHLDVDTYIFDPIFVSTTNSNVSLYLNSTNLNSKVFISASAIRM